MKQLNTKSKAYQVLTSLKAGERLTAKDAEKYNIGNLGTEVYRIRQAGYAVQCVSKTLADGTKTAEYSLGTPTLDIVALGYLAKSKGLTFESLSQLSRNDISI